MIYSRALARAHHCSMPQIHKEGGEHTNYEDDLVSQTNIDRRYGCLSTTNKHIQPASFGHSGTSAQMSGRNNRRILQDYFLTSHTHHENPENIGEPHTYPGPLLLHHHQYIYLPQK